MEITRSQIQSTAFKFQVIEGKKEIGRAFLYIIHNDLHDEPFGLLEDVFIDQDYRQQGIGKKLINNVLAEAKKQNCYKVLATSRHSRPLVHDFYAKLGFKEQGYEFRIDLKQ